MSRIEFTRIYTIQKNISKEVEVSILNYFNKFRLIFTYKLLNKYRGILLEDCHAFKK